MEGEGRGGKEKRIQRDRKEGTERTAGIGGRGGGEGAGWKRGGKRWLHSGFLTHRGEEDRGTRGV